MSNKQEGYLVTLKIDDRNAGTVLNRLKKDLKKTETEALLLVNSLNRLGKTDFAKHLSIYMNQLNSIANKNRTNTKDQVQGLKEVTASYSKLNSIMAQSKAIVRSNLSGDTGKSLNELGVNLNRLSFNFDKVITQRKRWASSDDIKSARKFKETIDTSSTSLSKLTQKYIQLDKIRTRLLSKKSISKQDYITLGVVDNRLKRINDDLAIQKDMYRKLTVGVSEYKDKLSGMTLGKQMLNIGVKSAMYTTAFTALYSLQAGLRKAGKAVIDFDKQQRTLQAVLNVSANKANVLENSLRDLSTIYGGSIEDINEVALSLGRAGVATKDLNNASKVAISMAMLTGDSFQTATSAIVVYNQNYKDQIEAYYQSANVIEVIGNKLAYVANESRLSTKDIGIFSNYAVAVAHTSGITIDSLGAMGVAFSNLGNNASTIGTMIRRLGNMFTNSSKATSSFFNSIGMNQQNLLGELQKSLDGTKEGVEASNDAFKIFVESVQSLSPDDFNKLTAGMGTLQKTTLSSLINATDLVKTQKELINTTNGQLDQAVIIANSYASILERLANKIEQSWANVEKTNNFLSKLISGLADITMHLLQDQDENKIMDTAKAFLKVNNELKTLKELGLQGADSYKKLTKEATEYKTMLKELNNIKETKDSFDIVFKQFDIEKYRNTTTHMIGQFGKDIGNIQKSLENAEYSKVSDFIKRGLKNKTGEYKNLATALETVINKSDKLKKLFPEIVKKVANVKDKNGKSINKAVAVAESVSKDTLQTLNKIVSLNSGKHTENITNEINRNTKIQLNKLKSLAKASKDLGGVKKEVLELISKSDGKGSAVDLQQGLLEIQLRLQKSSGVEAKKQANVIKELIKSSDTLLSLEKSKQNLKKKTTSYLSTNLNKSTKITDLKEKQILLQDKLNNRYNSLLVLKNQLKRLEVSTNSNLPTEKKLEVENKILETKRKIQLEEEKIKKQKDNSSDFYKKFSLKKDLFKAEGGNNLYGTLDSQIEVLQVKQKLIDLEVETAQRNLETAKSVEEKMRAEERLTEAKWQQQKANEAVSKKEIEKNESWTQAVKRGVENRTRGQLTANQLLTQSTEMTYDRMSDTLAEYVASGKADFKGMLSSLLHDLSVMYMKQAIMVATAKAIASATGGGSFMSLFGFADGGVIPTKNFASGGMLTGGSGVRDDLYLGKASGSHVFAMGGEYITNKSATKSIGVQNMEYMNKTGKIPNSSSNTNIIVNTYTSKEVEVTSKQTSRGTELTIKEVDAHIISSIQGGGNTLSKTFNQNYVRKVG